MADITMSREALECHLAAIDDRIEKTVNVLGYLPEYIEGDTAKMVKTSIEISVEMARSAQHAIDRLKSEAGIKVEEQVAA